jgi:hypothetical protein
MIAYFGKSYFLYILDTTVQAKCNDGSSECIAEHRRADAYSIRVDAAYKEYVMGIQKGRVNNGDESLYANKMNSFSKGLPHNEYGDVDLDAYEAMRVALSSGNHTDFEKIKLGCSPNVKLTDPQSSFDFDLQGGDSFTYCMIPEPCFNSAQQAGETTELYSMALMRDVNFDQYSTDPLATNACNNLNKMSDFRGPKVSDKVTPATLFRGSLSGCDKGPYISQFLYQPFHYGAVPIDQKSRQTTPGTDHLTTFPGWLNIQNGAKVPQPLVRLCRHILVSTYLCVDVY